MMHYVKQDRDVLKELLTTDRYFVQWPGSLVEYEKRIDYITKRQKKDNPKNINYRYFIVRPTETNKKSIPQANPTWRRTVLFYNIDPKDWDYPLEQPFKMPRRPARRDSDPSRMAGGVVGQFRQRSHPARQMDSRKSPGRNRAGCAHHRGRIGAAGSRKNPAPTPAKNKRRLLLEVSQ